MKRLLALFALLMVGCTSLPGPTGSLNDYRALDNALKAAGRGSEATWEKRYWNETLGRTTTSPVVSESTGNEPTNIRSSSNTTSGYVIEGNKITPINSYGGKEYSKGGFVIEGNRIIPTDSYGAKQYSGATTRK
jgi:hypothetical protein